MKSTTKKILLGCFEVPGYGGANTAAYSLFGCLQRDGFDVAYVNLIDREDTRYFQYVFGAAFGNPQGLANVHNCLLQAPLFDPHAELAALIRQIGPQIMIGMGYIAALLLKQAAPTIPLLFLTTGSTQTKIALAKKRTKNLQTFCQTLAQSSGRPPRYHVEERRALEASDLVLTHSDLILFLTQHLFPALNGQIYPQVIWWAEWIYHEALSYQALQQPFAKRDIDLLFISNEWSRYEKNYALVENLASALPDRHIRIVGEAKATLPHVYYEGFINDRERLFALMGQAKTVVCPSRFDAAPGILFEASAMGCNVIASKNCGNWQLCHEQLLVEPFHAQQFLSKIALSLTQKFPDNIDVFLKTKAYQQLVEIITVF